MPGVTVAEAAIQRIRALFSRPSDQPGARLWSLLERGERRGLLRRAGLDVELAGREWSGLDESTRDAVYAAWREWRDRVLYLATKAV